MKHLLLILLPATVLTGCFEDKQMVLDLTGKADIWSFYNQGFPTDFRVDADGRIDLSGFPHTANATIHGYKKVVERDNRASLLKCQFISDLMAITRKVISIYPSDPLSFLEPHSSIQLIDVDADSTERGKRFPISADFLYKYDEYRPDDLLQVLPVGEYLKENTTYALVVTRNISLKYKDKLIPNEVLNKYCMVFHQERWIPKYL